MRFEADLIKALQKASNGFSNFVNLGITQLGTELAFLIVAVVLYWCIDKRYAYRFFNVYILGVAVTNFLKLGFKRTRPFEAYPDEIESIGGRERTYSFPSGHTESIASVSTMLTMKYGKDRTWVPVTLGCVTLLVMISRMFLGQHYLSDVFCGLTLGVFCAIAFNALLSLFGDKEEWFIIPNVILTASILAALGGLGMFEQASGADILKGVGAFFAFDIGYFLEKRYVKFDVKENRSLLNCAFRIIIGAGVTIGIQYGFKAFLPKDVALLYCFLRYFLMAAWASLGAPALFKVCNALWSKLYFKKCLSGGGTKKFTVQSAEQMKLLGDALAETLSGGSVVLLSGELGAGKTVLCKGIAKGLGISSPVVSPTFTLMNEYFGRVEFCHFDAYRLEDADEAVAAGLDDYIGNPACICAVEWWQNISPLFENLKTVKITIDKPSENVREVTVEK